MNRREFFRSTVGVSAAAIVLPNLPERKSVRQGVLLEHCIAPGQATALQLLDHEGRDIPCMRREVAVLMPGKSIDFDRYAGHPVVASRVRLSQGNVSLVIDINPTIYLSAGVTARLTMGRA